MDFKENGKKFIQHFGDARGPIVWPSRARFGPRAAN